MRNLSPSPNSLIYLCSRLEVSCEMNPTKKKASHKILKKDILRRLKFCNISKIERRHEPVMRNLTSNLHRIHTPPQHRDRSMTRNFT